MNEEILLLKKLKNLDEKAKEKLNKFFDFEIIDFESKDELFTNKFIDFKKQKIIIIKDKFFEREAILSPKRIKRPQPEKQKITSTNDCQFCKVDKETPEDKFGRLENNFAITALNISQAAPYHSLIIFKKHNFTELTIEDFGGAYDLAKTWFEKAKSFDKQIKTQLFIWNQGFRSGASKEHPHWQIFSFHHHPYKLINFYNKIKSSEFEEYLNALKELGLVYDKDMKLWFDLTPAKEKGFSFILDKEECFKIWRVIQVLDSNNFNLIYVYSSILNNFGFFVDRGTNDKINCDFGTLEIFLSPIISSDPCELAEKIFKEIY